MKKTLHILWNGPLVLEGLLAEFALGKNQSLMSLSFKKTALNAHSLLTDGLAFSDSLKMSFLLGFLI